MRTAHVRISSLAAAAAAALVAAAPAGAQLPALFPDSGAVAFQWSVLAGPGLGASFRNPPSTGLGANWRMRGTGFGVRTELLYSGIRSAQEQEWVRAGFGPDLAPCPGCSSELRWDHLGLVTSVGYELHTGTRLRPYVLGGAGVHHGWVWGRSFDPDMAADLDTPGCRRGEFSLTCQSRSWNTSLHVGTGLALRIGEMHVLGELRMEEFGNRGFELRPLIGVRF